MITTGQRIINEQIVVLRVRYAEEDYLRDPPALWDWEELVGDEVDVIGWGPLEQYEEE